MGTASRYEDWLKEAEDDFKAAKYLLEGGRYSKACFYSQQAVEKALKALLIRRCGRYETSHSGAALITTLRGYLDVGEELVSMANKLDRYYVPTRYPNAWPAGAPSERYGREDAEEATKNAAAILEFVKANLG